MKTRVEVVVRRTDVAMKYCALDDYVSETAPWGFLSGPPSTGRDLGHEVAPVSSSVVVDFGAPRHVDGRGTNSDCNSVIGGEVGPV